MPVHEDTYCCDHCQSRAHVLPRPQMAPASKAMKRFMPQSFAYSVREDLGIPRMGKYSRVMLKTREQKKKAREK